MTYLVGFLLVAYALGVVSLVWNCAKTYTLLRQERERPSLSTVDAGATMPTLDVIVPVKDEEHHIAACLQSIIAQRYPHFRILVVDDRSTDGTPQVIEALRRDHPNMEYLRIHELPPGLYGKPHALHEASKQFRGEFVAFVDSDLKLEPHCLSSLVHQLETNRLDWVAAMGAPQIIQFWERLLVPQLGAVTFAWYDPRKISDPKWPNAIGSALMIARRSAYEAIGGHESVIRTYDEDSELIRNAKRAGQRVSFVLVPELYTQRHYGTLARTVRGLTRTFVGGIKTLPRLLLTIHALNFVSLLPLGLLALLFGLWTGGVAVPWLPYWIGTAAIHLLVSTTLAWLVYRTAGIAWGYALLHPLGSLVLIGVCFKAIMHVCSGEAIQWRGTTYAEGAGTPKVQSSGKSPD